MDTLIGRRKENEFMRTERGALFKKYPYGKFPEYKEVIFNFPPKSKA